MYVWAHIYSESTLFVQEWPFPVARTRTVTTSWWLRLAVPFRPTPPASAFDLELLTFRPQAAAFDPGCHDFAPIINFSMLAGIGLNHT